MGFFTELVFVSLIYSRHSIRSQCIRVFIRTVFKISLCSNTFGFFDRAQLVKLRLRAMRAGVWFRALRRIDRVLIELTIRVADSVRSVTLARSLSALAGKLEGLLESTVSRAAREVGVPLAQKISLAAQKWGNASAKSWATAPSLARFLAVMYINDPKTFNHDT